MQPEELAKKVDTALEPYSPDELGMVIDRMLVKAVTPERIQSLLEDLLSASNTKELRSGETFQAPEWATRNDSFKTLLKIHPATRNKMKEDDVRREMPPSKIVFVTVNNTIVKEEKKDVIDVGANEGGAVSDVPGSGDGA